ncbi:MAG TPA: tyrosinase family protein [Actinomycetes bacterium]|nr:tyrosinase family protein [Actinomycetes bacterium]
MGTGQVAVRRNVWSLDPTEAFASQVTLNYARAVAVMQQRAPNDPTSWTYQANVHGTYDQVPPGAAWNQCQHGTWFFLPWHRMYLYFFEQVVREAIAEAGADPTGWALPYWNYGDGPQPPVNTLPLAFRAPSLPNGAANPLYLPYPLRNDGTDPRVPLAAGINDGGQLPAFYLDYRQAFAYPNYAYPPAPDPGFGGPQTGVSHSGATHGALEQQPHDVLHVLVGGVPTGQCQSGWMSDPDCAAHDPIFWLHHANIDRLWKRWLDVAGHADPAQAAWLDRSFRFYDPARREVRAMTAREVLDTVEQLGYGYDDDPPPAARPIRRAAPPERVLAGSASGRRLLGSAGPLAVAGRPVRAAGELVGEAAEAAAAAGAAEADAPHLNLNLEGVDRDPDSALLLDVYLNLPAQAAPDPRSPHYVGAFAFFGHTAHGHPPAEEEEEAAGQPALAAHQHRGNTFTFDITGLVDQQRTRHLWSDTGFAVTVVPGGQQGPQGTASVAAAAEAEAPQMGEVRISRVTITAE